MSDQPWWAKSAWQLGPLAIGFLMLLAAFLGWNPFRQDNGSARAVQHFQRTMDGHAEQSRDMLQILRKICRHVARSESSKEDCDR